MFQPYELFIGLRYTRAKRRNHFISFISLISILGIALGVMALITVISVMNGFEKELRERILGAAAHATISYYDKPMKEWRLLADRSKEHPEVIGAAPYVEGQVMLVNADRVTGALIRGVIADEEAQVSEVGAKMLTGELNDLKAGEFGILLGSDLAQFLNVSMGDKITVISPEAGVTPIGVLPRLKRFTVKGLFQIGMYEYDRNMAVIQADDASRLLRMQGGYTGVRLKLSDMFGARAVARDLAQELGEDYWVTDWTLKHANFFQAVKTEKTVMFVILTLIVAVAAFNIVSTLVMVVTDKQSDIAILRTLGSSPASVMAVFLVQGTIIGVFGSLLGLIGGISLALNIETVVPFVENLFGTHFLDPSVYSISELPSDLRWPDVLKIALVSFIISLLATLYPAWRASRVEPAEALAYE